MLLVQLRRKQTQALGATSTVLDFELQDGGWKGAASRECWSGTQKGTCSGALAPYGQVRPCSASASSLGGTVHGMGWSRTRAEDGGDSFLDQLLFPNFTTGLG